jgi:hypothetical protein
MGIIMSRTLMVVRATLAYGAALILVTLAAAELIVTYGVGHPFGLSLQNQPLFAGLGLRTAARLTAAANFLPNVISYGVAAHFILRQRVSVPWPQTTAAALLCALLTPLLWFAWMFLAVRPWPVVGGSRAMFVIWLMGASFGPGVLTAQLLRWPSPSTKLARL